jgi:AAA15 family ATPase/GTPase
MIEELRIENFRCFDKLTVSKLKRMNIIVGTNSSGKTSLLESLFMVAGAAAPNATFQLRALRQLGNQVQIAGDPSVYKALWEDLFHWYDQKKMISISATGSTSDSRSLSVYYTESSNQLLPFGDQDVPSAIFPQINFEWKRGTEDPVVVKPKLTAKGLEFEGNSFEYFPVIFFAPHATSAPDENARRFSALSRDGNVDSIIEALKAEYSFIESLSIEYASNIPSVFASLKGSKKKLPLGLLSDGVNKFLGILLGIATFPKGTVLIDQIEDGFYFDRLESIWRTVHRFAVRHEVQMFITTHSRECLNAMRPVLEEYSSDFCLLRAKRDKTTSSVAHFSGSSMFAALQKNGEIR